MSNSTKDVIFKGIVNAALVELLPETSVDQIRVGDVTFGDKLAEMITAINLRAKIEYVDESIGSLRQEILGDVPVDAYNTFTEMAEYIAEHEDICEALTAAIGNKADQSEVDAIKMALAALGGLSSKDKVSETDLDPSLAAKINDNSDIQAELDKKLDSDGIVVGISKDGDGYFLETADGSGPVGIMTTDEPLGILASKDEVSESDLDAELTEKINSTQTKIDEAVESLGDLAGKDKVSESDLDTALAAKINDTDAKIEEAMSGLGALATKSDVSESDLNAELAAKVNDKSCDISDVSGLMDALNSKVPNTRTINGKALTDDISLSASDVGADPSGSAAGVLGVVNSHTSDNDIHVTAKEKALWNGISDLGVLASKDEVSEDELDPTLLAKINASSGDIAALGDLASKDKVSESDLDTSLSELIDSKVPNTRTINGKALTNNISLTVSDVGADTLVSSHNSSPLAHSDIRSLISELTTRLNALANSDDTTLDQMSELVEYIKDNRELIESVTTNKVNVTDIVNNLTTNSSNKPLSAAQGVAIKGLIDALDSELSAHTSDDVIHITATERTNWNDANSKKHSHSNKTVLDGIDSTDITNWDDANSKKHSHSNKTVLDGIDSTDITNWNDANSKKHSHSNKTVLDGIDSTDITNWDDANSKKHSHSNKDILDATTASYTTEDKAKVDNIKDILPVANGGTGQSTAVNAANAMINALTTQTTTPQDADYFISQSPNGGTTTTTYHRRPMSSAWNYIKGKIENVLGLTAAAFGGNAATATKLAESKTIKVNLASTTAAGFDGSANVTPGVSGILPIANGGTGASTAKAAIAALGGLDLASIGTTAIPSSANLDNYKTAGNYYSAQASVTNSLTNCPVTGAGFRLIVMKAYTGTRVHQIIFPNSKSIWVRYYDDSTWSDWYDLTANTAYVHPSYTAKASGLYKVTVDSTGHVSAVAEVTKSDITALGIPESDTDTTYPTGSSTKTGTTKLYTGTGTNTDGTMTQNAISTELSKISDSLGLLDTTVADIMENENDHRMVVSMISITLAYNTFYTDIPVNLISAAVVFAMLRSSSSTVPAYYPVATYMVSEGTLRVMFNAKATGTTTMSIQLMTQRHYLLDIDSPIA